MSAAEAVTTLQARSSRSVHPFGRAGRGRCRGPPAAHHRAPRRPSRARPVRSGLVADRAVLVTGGSRGIGRAIAVAFANLGDRVAVHHRDSAALATEVVAGLPGSGHTVVQADLADPEAARRAVDAAGETLGGLDILVNNAGLFTPHPITEVSYAHCQAPRQPHL